VAGTTVGFEFEVGALAAPAGSRDEDAALVAGLCAGEESAYETLILRYEQPVFSIVSRLTYDPADAPDVVQEVFLKVFRKVSGFRGESSLKTWIYRIAVNEARNYRRWFGRHRSKEIDLDPHDSGEHSLRDCLADPGPSPFEVTLDHETQALLETALQQVSAPYRAALVLREVEGLNYDEIAEVLEISLGTVKSRILRGREALRKLLAERLEATRVQQGGRLHLHRNGGRPKEVMQYAQGSDAV
jgi:RNA polymerase sigma-70 factor (ECF subfamily)